MNNAKIHNSLRLTSLFLFLLGAGTNIFSQKVHQIDILNSNLTASDVRIGKDATKLIGEVNLKHDDAIMFCDSAYYYPSTFSVDAFSNVRVLQGDTLTLTGDKLDRKSVV